MLLNDLMRQFNESVEQTGPRFTGYWKAKDPAPAGKKMVGSESAINELNKSPKNKFETMQYGNWTIDMSLDPIMMPKITGNTAMFVARATHKKDARGILFGKGNSQAAARDDVLSQINDNLRSANPDDFTQFTIDLNVDFTKNYLDPKSGNYFKLQKDDAGQPVLVMASREYFANFGKEMEDLGFRKATSRIKITGNNSIPVYALAISKNAVKSLGLIPNMRYTLEEVGQDSDGNTMFSLKADTRTLGKHDKYRMGVPGLTLAASTLESTMEDSNPTDKITMDVPLFLRMMEYAKEDAKTDMDLHDVTERAIALMKEHEYLCMDNYSDLVGGEATGGEQPTNEFKDTAKYGDDSGKNINHEIFQLLKNGATVYSNAAGRMGKVLRANNDGVVIASKRGKGFTSFNSGDPVAIKQDENDPNTYHIINEEKKGLYYYVNKRKKAGTSRPKGHPKAPSDQDWKNAAKTAKEDVNESQLEEGLLGQAIGLIGAYYGVQAGLPDVIMNTMDLPTGTYTIVQHLLGGGAGYVGGVVLGNAAGKATKKLIAKMLWSAIKKAYQSIKGGTPEQQAMKNLDAEVKAIEARIKQAIATGGKAEPKLFKDQPVKTEGKIKGADGKACWKGHRYAGTEDGKDKCVPVKKGE